MFTLSIPMLAMHAPDRLFSMPVNVVFAVLVIALVAIAIRKLGNEHHHMVPMMGLSAAFIFAAQMLNFPIAGGTTGHLLGGTLAAIILGPWAGLIVMVAVVVVQAILFQDGGITVLGTNIFNMGVIGCFGAYWIFRVLGGSNGQSTAVTGRAFFSAWCGVVFAAVAASIELALSNTVALNRCLPPMLYTHMLIGLGEGLITAAIVGFLLRTRPELLYQRSTDHEPSTARRVIPVGLAISLIFGMALCLLPELWPYPDGLEYVTEQLGVLPDSHARFTIMPEYQIPGMTGLLSTSIAGGAGTLIMFVLSFGIGRWFSRPATELVGKE